MAGSLHYEGSRRGFMLESLSQNRWAAFKELMWEFGEVYIGLSVEFNGDEPYFLL